ncbi:MAG: hypothetical protein KDE35_05910 [Geminicoccaceae bacterium]|nr:hypothetical protein [Geminicoccaceae bacterium]
MHEPWTSGDLVDLALFGSTVGRGRPVDRLIDEIMQLCAPTLRPGVAFVEGRLSRAILLDLVALNEDDRLAATIEGVATFRRAMARPVDHVDHAAAACCEALKVAFFDLLDPADAVSIWSDVVGARCRALDEERRAVRDRHTVSPAVDRCRLFRLAVAERVFDTLNRDAAFVRERVGDAA